jgi:hypothetical protein
MPKVKVNLPPAPRLPKEPDPKMLRTFGPRPSFDDLTPPDPAIPIASPSPSAYRRENPDNAPPPEYKPPSMLAEHKALAILFLTVCIVFAFYCWRTPHVPNALTAAPNTAAAAAASSAAASAPERQTPVRQTPAPNAAPAAVQPKQPIYVETVPET